MRSVVAAVAFMLCVPARATAQSPAPNGEAVYRQHCARCHEGTMPRMPSREALRAVTPEHIDTALSSFSMRREGASLSPAERRAVAEFLTGRPAGSYRAPLDAIARSAFCGPGASSSRDLLEGASWNGWGGDLCPAAAGPDHDFSSSPNLTLFPDGRRVLVAGQKSGALYGINPESGELIWKTQAGEGGVLGGIEWGFATDGSVAFVSLSGAFEKKAGDAGGLLAVNVVDGTTRWSAPPSGDTCRGRIGCSTAQPAAVSVIPGAVFSGSLDGHLRAYASDTGRVILDLDTAREFETVNGIPARGGSLNGPGATVAGGMLFVSSGYGSLGFMPGNVVLAFSVDGK